MCGEKVSCTVQKKSVLPLYSGSSLKLLYLNSDLTATLQSVDLTPFVLLNFQNSGFAEFHSMFRKVANMEKLLENVSRAHSLNLGENVEYTPMRFR
jgi:hypothetical protein